MTANKKHISLPEEDYLAIIGTITNLHQCRTRKELKQCFNAYLLPLFEADAMGTAFGDIDIGNQELHRHEVFFTVGKIKEIEHEALGKMFPYHQSISNTWATTTKTVVAHDIDLPRDIMKEEVNKFFADHPAFKREDFPSFDEIETTLAITARPDFDVGIGINRFGKGAKAWTRREVRIAELLQPNLMQSIRNIGVIEELKKYRMLADALADTPTAIALVNADHRVIYRNDAFGKLLDIDAGRKLNKRLSELMRSQSESSNPQTTVDINLSGLHDIPFIQLEQGVFRLTSSRVESPDGDEDCRLIRLKPAVDPYSQMTIVMQTAGLTGREREIACMVKDGMTDAEISLRLFIAESTVRNHLKSIFKKLKVDRRSKVVAKLSQME